MAMNFLGKAKSLDNVAYTVVGDIHGSLDQLQCLLGKHELFTRRKAVFLGDYVDVGPDGKSVISRLLRFAALAPDSVFLCGNHDFLMMDYYRSGDFVRYATRDGLPTIRSYVGEAFGNVHQQFRASVPAEHLKFVEELKPFFEPRDYLFSHCGYSVSEQSDRSLRTMVLTSHQDLFTSPKPLDKYVVFGHYFQRTHRPRVRQNLVCLDTGCGINGGPLTALLLPEKICFSVRADLSIQSTLLSDTDETGAPPSVVPASS